MRTLLFLLLSLLALSPFAHGDELQCSNSAGANDKTELKSGAAVVGLKGDALDTEASLAPGSFLVTLQDKENPVRTAFVGHPGAAARGTLTQGKHRLDCSRSKAPLVIPHKRKNNYLVCFLDSAEMKDGALLADAKRQLPKVVPVLGAVPRSLEAANEKYSYRLELDDLNPNSGFKLSLSDRASGLSTSFEGPAATMGKTVIMALTVGDRAKEARFLRVGCEFTDTLANIKDVK